ncbi:hypothetical protein C9374_004346 [Naegleria lovaniensis]|uniref:ATP-dependent RNA helicase n=1 Tax=Naegleria lovaniensis TaxID=51637 RepID=A0AA88KLI1_NAELO|nr:uncharacterized protein C9374_004346 [Naegleria lovaniensis]KAG2383675.1 hypothetical protein C9374_004346 [Naegleria lovaniensis]
MTQPYHAVVFSNKRHNMTLFTLLCLLLIALALSSGIVTVHALLGKKVIDDFNRTSISPWGFSNGPEYPGAIGSLTLAPNGFANTPAALLRYNLTKGSYVAAQLKFNPQLHFSMIAFKVKTSDTNSGLSLRLVDSSGQTFQYGLFGTIETYNGERDDGRGDQHGWRDIVLSTSTKPSFYFGGPNDGVMKLPFKEMSILLSVVNRNVAPVGFIMFDEIVATNQTNIELNSEDFIPSAFIPKESLGIDILPRYGVCVHFTTSPLTFDIIKNASLTWIRTDLFWGTVETVKGQYNFAKYDPYVALIRSRGLKLLFILTYGNSLYQSGAPTSPEAIEAFANYTRACVKHYGGNDIIYEIYNEANGNGFTGEQYANLSKAAIDAAHQVDPTVLISTSGLAGVDLNFLRAYLSKGGGYGANAIGLHPYFIGNTDASFGRLTEGMRRFRGVINEFVNETLGIGGSNSPIPSHQVDLTSTIPPVWETEWGLTSTDYDSTSNGHNYTALKIHGNAVVSRFLVSTALGLPLIMYYDFKNDGNNPSEREHNFGLLFNNGTDKPAMRALRQLTKSIKGRLFDGFLRTEHPFVNAMRFKGENDSLVIVWPVDFYGNTSVKAVNASTIVNVFGEAMTFKGNEFNVNMYDGPVYLTFPESKPVKPIISSSPIPSKTEPAKSRSERANDAVHIDLNRSKLHFRPCCNQLIKKTQKNALSKSFDDLANSNTEYQWSLLRGIYSYGLEYPTFVQQCFLFGSDDEQDGSPAYSPSKTNDGQAKRNWMVQGSIGHGKTIAYIIGLLMNFDEEMIKNSSSVLGVILCPTDLLVLQVQSVLNSISDYINGFMSKALLRPNGDIRSSRIETLDLSSQPHVIVSTSSNLLYYSSCYDLSKLKVLVIDEMDIMLDFQHPFNASSIINDVNDKIYSSHRKNIRKIFSKIPSNTDILCFGSNFPSVTCYQYEERLSNCHMIRTSDHIVHDNISESFEYCPREGQKFQTLLRIIATADNEYHACIIFCQDEASVLKLFQKLNSSRKHKDVAKLINLEAPNRPVLEAQNRILITIDEAFIGIDIHRINLVVHYDIARDVSTCKFRSGRCGRLGRPGYAYYLPATPEELDYVHHYFHNSAKCPFARPMLSSKHYHDLDISFMN